MSKEICIFRAVFACVLQTQHEGREDTTCNYYIHKTAGTKTTTAEIVSTRINQIRPIHCVDGNADVLQATVAFGPQSVHFGSSLVMGPKANLSKMVGAKIYNLGRQRFWSMFMSISHIGVVP